MFKARGERNDGAPVIVIGLSHRNLDLLREGQPIIFDLNELGLQGSMLILAGETEQAIAEELRIEAKAAGAVVHDTDPPPGSLKRN